jgi:hypothetical protein
MSTKPSLRGTSAKIAKQFCAGNEAIQTVAAEAFWIASLRSQ